MGFAPKEVVDALSSDVDNLRRELSQTRQLGQELRETQRQLRPLTSMRCELTRLVAEAKAVIGDSVLQRLTELERGLAALQKQLPARSSEREQAEFSRGYDAGAVEAKNSIAELQENVEALQAKMEQVEACIEPSTSPGATSSRSPGLADMDDAELQEEVCTVLSAVLDEYEGDSSGLINYGERRVKDLLAELRSRI